MFKPVSSKTQFPRLEGSILSFWEREGIFRKSLDSRKDAEEFLFYDGPPFATGLPHYGHLLAGTIKDIVPRYQTMRGRRVERRFGWDCHGLPVEYEVEQALEVSGKRQIEKLGVDVFNEHCRRIVLRYTREWREIVTRMGRWVDFDNDYKTMDPGYMESIWWVFKSLWDRNLVYEGHKILPFCPRCSTPLSNFETNQGYRDVSDPAITVRFALKGRPGTYILAWTTTPWTLPSNTALAVGRDTVYAKVSEGGNVYYIGKERLSDCFRNENDFRIVEEAPGSALVGMEYEPIFPFFAHLREEGAFRIHAADFVSTEEGTGVVHIAPGFGEDDSELAKARGIPTVCPVDAEGRFSGEVPDYAGRPVKETDDDIMRRLKSDGALVRRSAIVHPYPHCWRCDTPLIYKAVSTWFVRVEEIKDRLLAANGRTHWVPGHLKEGRFGKWLEQARDWAVSRNRYWGTPLPLWRSEDGREIVCVGSMAELERLSGRKTDDLHKHFVDSIEIPSADGKSVLKRVPEVLDCWFESGAMPYAQAHYPFENKDRFDKTFPADFIAEGLDQTRGWFYTLMVLSTALFDSPAFRHVIVNGLVLAEDGRKMSKRLKNYPDPQYMINTYGADALRLYLISSPVVRAEDLRFSETGVKQVLRDLLIPVWNAYSFFVTYANTDGWSPGKAAGRPSGNVLDRWIRSSLERLVGEVSTAMDGYDLQGGVRPFLRFMDDLTNWYIRRSRRRFWKSQNDEDKAQAYETLWRVLLEWSKVAAPFIPFIAEAVYSNLRTDDMPESVHLCAWPVADARMRDESLERMMEAAIAAVRLGRLLRAEHELKVRQPLARMHLVSRDPVLLKNLEEMKDVILEELNVKAAVLEADERGLAELRCKADFRKLGPRFGGKVKAVAGALAGLDQATIRGMAEGRPATIAVGGEEATISAEEVIIDHLPLEGVVVASSEGILVAMETRLTDALLAEGLAREFVSKIQNMRKSADLVVTDRIAVVFRTEPSLRAAIEAHREYVMNETLCTELVSDPELPADTAEWDINGIPCAIAVSVA